MRKAILTISLFISFCLIFNFFNPVYAAKKKKTFVTKQKIEFTTKDKFILVGDMYLANPKTDKPLVIMLHSFSMNALCWNTLAENLRSKGYNVLAMDLRGHARSIYSENLKLKSRYKFTNADWQKLPSDVIQSVDYVKSNYPWVNCEDVIIVGADLGASAGILAGDKMKKQPLKFVLISPLVNFKGLYILVKIANFQNSKFLFMTSSTDRTSARNVKVLLPFVQTKATVKEYPYGGAGVQLLKVNPESNNDLINFIIN